MSAAAFGIGRARWRLGAGFSDDTGPNGTPPLKPGGTTALAAHFGGGSINPPRVVVTIPT
jgi:hypothetical protein